MPAPTDLLSCVASAFVKCVPTLGQGLLVELLPEVAEQAWQWWNKGNTERRRRQELQEMLTIAEESFHKKIETVVRDVARQESEQIQEMLRVWLLHIPAIIRQVARRPNDPGGTTVPMAVSVQKPSDLIRFLPPKLPRLTRG